MMTEQTHVTLSLDQVGDLSRAALSRLGLAAAHVEAVTATIVAGERDGCASHGIYRLLVCADTLKTGKVAKDADPTVDDRAAGVVRVDARGGYAQLAFQRGLPLLVDKARKSGIAAMAINDCVHFAALWPEIRGWSAGVREQIEIEAAYAGYLDRQDSDIRAFRADEALALPDGIDVDTIGSLSTEIRQMLRSARPPNLGAAARLPGMTPAALIALLKHVKRQDVA